MTGLTRRRVLAGVAAAAGPAWADGRSALYQATAIVTGSDERERPAGFARCLREVIGKLTARRGTGMRVALLRVTGTLL